MIKFSEAASLALHTMSILADEPHKMFSNKELAKKLNASSAHLAKVMQRLAKAKLVRSLRGPNGGFILAEEKEQINLLDIYQAVEGQYIDKTCLFSDPVCNGKECIFGGLLIDNNRRIRDYLKNTKISQLKNNFGTNNG